VKGMLRGWEEGEVKRVERRRDEMLLERARL
jgi:hypothetical protein